MARPITVDLDEIRWLAEHGLRPFEIARKFGVTEGALERAALRAGDPVLAARLRGHEVAA